MIINTEAMQQVCDLFKHLANEVRLKILFHLNTKNMTVMELNKKIPVSQSALSQHLKMLRLAKLIQHTKRGTSVEYSLVDEVIRVLLNEVQKNIIPLLGNYPTSGNYTTPRSSRIEGVMLNEPADEEE